MPEAILATIEPPASLQIRGHGQLLEARVCRFRKHGSGEADAVLVSDVLPFVEFELHRQMMLKLRVFGMNAAFGYCSQIQVSNTMVVAVATATAVYADALPPPAAVQIARSLEIRTQEDVR